MGALERLEARPRRRARVTLLRPEAETATRQYIDLTRRLKAAEQAGDEDQQASLRSALAEVTQFIAGQEEADEVELVALEPDEFEEIRAAYIGDDGDIDIKAMRPVLVAACCPDAADQDPDRWRAVMSDGSLHAGAVESLWQAAYGLNASYAPVEYLTAPKG